MLLVLSLLVLACGPLLVRAAKSRPQFLSALDSFIVVSIGGLVFLEILPASLREGGFLALVFAMVGLVGPGLAERYLREAARRAHVVTLLLALIGLALHASLDGAALSVQSGSLASAVILHRLPVALAIWALMRPKYGVGAGGAVLAFIGAATVLGFVLGDAMLDALSGASIRCFEALVAGSLVHVIFHAPHAGRDALPSETSQRAWDALGSIAGLVTVAFHMLAHEVGATSHEGHAHAAIFPAFLTLALAIAPALYVAYFIAAIVRALEPRSIADVRPSSRLGEALQGVILGVRAPVCTECNLPLVQSCIRVGMPVAAVLAILVAAPGLSLDALLVAVPLLGVEFALLKLTGTVIVALVVGAVLGRWLMRSRGVPSGPLEIPETDCETHPPEDPLVMARRQFVEVVDRTAPWILFGTGIAAVSLEVIGDTWFGTMGDLQIPLFALAGMLINLGPAGAMPLLVVLLAKGASVGAVMAFAVTSPVAGVATIACLGDQYGGKGVIGFLAIVIVIAVGVGFAADALLPEVAIDKITGPDTRPVELADSNAVEPPEDDGHDHSEDDGHVHAADDPRDHANERNASLEVWNRSGWVDRICLALVAVLMLMSFLRRGARRFFGQVFMTEEDGDPRHHHHHHDHA